MLGILFGIRISLYAPRVAEMQHDNVGSPVFHNFCRGFWKTTSGSRAALGIYNYIRRRFISALSPKKGCVIASYETKTHPFQRFGYAQIVSHAKPLHPFLQSIFSEPPLAVAQGCAPSDPRFSITTVVDFGKLLPGPMQANGIYNYIRRCFISALSP